MSRQWTLGGVVAGRAVEIARQASATFGRAGIAVIDDNGPVLRLEAENEYLLALLDGEPVASCPDLAATRLLREPDQVVADLVTRTATACAAATGGVDGLVDQLTRAWQRPVWLLDGIGRLVAGPEPGPGETDLLTRAVGDDGPGATRIAVAVPPGLPAEHAAVTAALAVAVESMGNRLAGQRLTVERDGRLRTSLLAELLQTTGDPASATRRRALDAGWEFQHEPIPTELQRHATATRRAQWLLRTSVLSAMGVGRVHQGVAGLARTLGEAGDAARLATTRTASGYFVHVDRLGLGRLLLAWTRTDTFLPAARSMLDPLHGQPGDLLGTLTAYLDAESSLTGAAAVLGVHRNTVASRIARAQDLLGVELNDPDERLALHLACRSVMFHTWPSKS